MKIRCTEYKNALCFQIDPATTHDESVFLPAIQVVQRESTFTIQTLTCGDINKYEACHLGIALMAAGSLSSWCEMGRAPRIAEQIKTRNEVRIGGVDMNVFNDVESTLFLETTA